MAEVATVYNISTGTVIYDGRPIPAGGHVSIDGDKFADRDMQDNLIALINSGYIRVVVNSAAVTAAQLEGTSDIDVLLNTIHRGRTDNPHTVTAAQLGLSGPMDLIGPIAVPADFPALAAVNVGDSYIITADVGDTDPGGTLTNMTFIQGDEITWVGLTWVILGASRRQVIVPGGAPYMVLDDDYTLLVRTIAGPGDIILPPALGRAMKRIAIKDIEGAAPINITPFGADTIDLAPAYPIVTPFGYLYLESDGIGNWIVRNNYLELVTHIGSTGNPHSVTALQTGAPVSVDGVDNAGGDIDLVAADAVTIVPDNVAKTVTIGESHSALTNNPHGVIDTQLSTPTINPVNWAAAAPVNLTLALDRLAAAVAGILGFPIP